MLTLLFGRPLSQRPLVQRLALGLVCGALAWGLNRVDVSILSAESPKFAFGGLFVLFAFRVLGPMPGVIAATLAFTWPYSIAEMSALRVILYAIEGAVVSRLAGRTRSVVVADVVFWLTGGAFLDAMAYVWLMGLTPGYVLILVLKQLLNGVMNAAVAEAAIRFGPLARVMRQPEEAPRTWQEVLFDRTVPVVMIPMTVIVLLLARASHDAVRSNVAAELRAAATNAERGAVQFLQNRQAWLESLRDQLGPAPERNLARADSLLHVFLTEHTEFLNVFLADAHGIVLSAAPLGSSVGQPLRGRDISRRPYFSAVERSGRTEFGDLVLGSLQVRKKGTEPVLPLAVPVARAGEGFHGLVMGAIDAGALRYLIGARVRSSDPTRAGTEQVLDRSGRVVVSSSSEWEMGRERAPELGSLMAGTGEVRTLDSNDTTSYAGRLDVAPRLTITQTVGASRFVVLVDEPLSRVHRDLIPTSLGLILLMLFALLAVYAVARTLGAQLAAPLQSIGAVAETLAGGEPVPREVLDKFEASSVWEIRTLASQLRRMDDALRVRRESDAEAVQQSESRYRETLEQLAQAQKMEGIGRLAGGIAHDFNNLLTPIIGYTDLALASVAPESPARKDLSLVRTAAGKAKEVVAQLLAFGRAQVLDTRRIDLADVVLEFEPLLRKSVGLTHEVVVTVESGVVVDADRAKVQQVLMNLVMNAADAMPTGGRVDVWVGVEELGAPDPADPEPIPAGRYGVCVVQDHGTGMDEMTRQRAFDPFFTTKPRGKGTGLGLSTAYGIVRQHRGTILVSSAPGEGTAMRVYFPLVASAPIVPAAAVSTPITVPPRPVTTSDAPCTVLVVEDEESVRELVRSALVRSGYRVLSARDGDEALTRAAAYDGRIDLLITDVLMPGADGREVARRFRLSRPMARVVFMSGYTSDVTAAGGALDGDAELLRKPFTLDELERRVREALQ